MKRISITNGSGKWFDAEKAELFKENTYWDGSNRISMATGSQFNHEAIYITSGGVFVINSWSDYQGSVETYNVISKREAATWFAKQSFSDEDIPSVFKEDVYSLEIK